MANQKTRKCAHIPCLCDVPDGQHYCGDACRDAGSEDVEIACQCDHPACPLTADYFVPRDAGMASLITRDLAAAGEKDLGPNTARLSGDIK